MLKALTFPGNYGNVVDFASQPSISSSVSPIVPRRKKSDVHESSDVFGTSPLSSAPFPQSVPFLSVPQDTTVTSKSTTPPEKPVIVEGNRSSHILV